MKISEEGKFEVEGRRRRGFEEGRGYAIEFAGAAGVMAAETGEGAERSDQWVVCE